MEWWIIENIKFKLINKIKRVSDNYVKFKKQKSSKKVFKQRGITKSAKKIVICIKMKVKIYLINKE